MIQTKIISDLNVVLTFLELSETDNSFLIEKVKTIIQDLEGYFGDSEFYMQQIRNTINEE
jgi:hypothetical protein